MQNYFTFFYQINRFAISTSNNLYFMSTQDGRNNISTYFKNGPLTYEGKITIQTLEFFNSIY